MTTLGIVQRGGRSGDGRLIRDNGDETPAGGWAGWTSDEFTAVREQARAANARVVLTVERFSVDHARQADHETTALGPGARATLAGEIVEALAEADADGVNLDFEPLPRTVRAEFVRLVREVRRTLDAVDPSLQLTFDLTPDVVVLPAPGSWWPMAPPTPRSSWATSTKPRVAGSRAGVRADARR